jgi:hypothetical protein
LEVDISVAEGTAGDVIPTELGSEEAGKSAECADKIIVLDSTVEITNIEGAHWKHNGLLHLTT